MNDEDLFAEFAEAAARTEPRHFDWLIARGVPRQFLDSGPMRFGVSPVMTASDGTFQIIDHGPRAIIMPAIPLYDGGDDVGDLVCWFPREPNRWWLRTGLVPVLNPLWIDRATIFKEPLSVWSSPLAWLRAAGAGVVVIDPSERLTFWFGDVSELIADSAELARDVERRMKVPLRLPRVSVRREAVAA